MKQLLCLVIVLLAPTLCCAEGPANPDVKASIALATGKYDVALELYQKGGADPNAQYEDGWTALMHTMKTVDPVLTEKSIELLIKAGADLEIRDRFGRTAMHYAVWKNPKGAEVLRRHGADPNPRDCAGLTPGELANALAEDPAALVGSVCVM